MIEYNRYSWWRTVFSIHGTVLPHVVGRVCEMTLWSVLLQSLYQTGMERGWITAENFGGGLDPIGHALLGSVLGFLIVFRMNASNNRYWEGRSHWGMIINTTRSLVRFAAAYSHRAKELADLMAGFVISLRQGLRNNRDLSEARIYLPPAVMHDAEHFGNPPTAVAAAASDWIVQRQREGVFGSVEVRHLEDLLAKLVDSQGGCERIQKTPLPFVYAAMIKQLILVYLTTLPLVLCVKCGWWTPVVVLAISIGFFGIEEASVETEDPFGEEENCLDLETYCLTVIRDTAQLADRAATREEPATNARFHEPTANSLGP